MQKIDFKVGDRCTIVSVPSSVSNNKIGRKCSIIDIDNEPDEDDELLADVLDDAGFRWWLSFDNLELIP